jgi:hypothetical protein
MGHKGVSIRKLPKAKSKPLASADHSGGLVSGLNQTPEAAGRQLPGKSGLYPASGSKNKHKK